MGIYSFETQVI